MKQSRQGTVLVVLQFAILALLVAGSHWHALSWLALLPGIAGLLLAAAALWAMRGSRFHIRPQPHPRGSLVLHGPYRYLRHPMYSSLILICLGLVSAPFSLPRLALFVALTAVLARKAKMEEALLEGHYPGYAEQMQKRWRLLPGIY